MNPFSRFANIFLFNIVNVDKIQNVVKKIKYEQSLKRCDYISPILSQVKAVEQELQIKSSEQINGTLTNEQLQIAGEMFLYLNTCPGSLKFREWFLFYKYLFHTKSAYQIMLTLNRIIHTKTSQDMDAKLWAKKLLLRTKRLLLLKKEDFKMTSYGTFC